MAQAEGTPSYSGERKRTSRFFGQYIIKHRFQFKYSLLVFLFLSLMAFVMWLEGYLAVKNMINSGMVAHEDAILQLKLLNNIMAKTSLIGLAIAFGLSLFLSHFIAGPLYRFERTLEEMRDGNLSVQVRLRPHDEFKEIAELFNMTLMSLRFKVKKERETLQASLDKMKSLSDKLKQTGQASEAGELEKLILEVRDTPPQIRI